MPGLDGTGPRGMGPMTGGMRGWCAPGGTGRPAGFGGGFARRGGRGNRRMYFATGLPGWMRIGGTAGAPVTEAAPVDELSALRAQADALQQRLSAIQARIAEIEKAE
ncbi:MAG TPA: DUF5320 domain-containing protein [Armatimonadota bacterium]|jgi:hypothetical protein|nr:DUF5320 domain-containing protein [Armatimonadota bacterium]HOM81322.1 DUF5320 domain-containing protein [Armatimonadota bacterium]HOQ28951.1 DUF5320 domain-containing protein [Armatimonadota bacterium]HPO72708.1 DUF5320 domain-containing protein [Armatimonadota bacterium]HPT97403.1 DUF5320 domain-containing protein [Armatimonadota bacterium]